MPEKFNATAYTDEKGVHFFLSGFLTGKESKKFLTVINEVYIEGSKLFFDISKLNLKVTEFNVFKQCFAHIPMEEIIFEGDDEEEEDCQCGCHDEHHHTCNCHKFRSLGLKHKIYDN